MSKSSGFVELLVTLSVTLCAVGAGLIYNYCFKAKPDNVVEELCEEVIKQKTGWDIDLTPDSPE